MLLGLVSDTHDNTAAAALVAAFFHERRVDMTFHLGDVMEPETLTAFGDTPLVVVRGNNDDHPWPDTWRQELAGVRIGATHGHMRGTLDALARECDIVLRGHTHRHGIQTVGSCALVNPGALYRAAEHTCALLELPTKKVVFYRVGQDGITRR